MRQQNNETTRHLTCTNISNKIYIINYKQQTVKRKAVSGGIKHALACLKAQWRIYIYIYIYMYVYIYIYIYIYMYIYIYIYIYTYIYIYIYKIIFCIAVSNTRRQIIFWNHVFRRFWKILVDFDRFSLMFLDGSRFS